MIPYILRRLGAGLVLLVAVTAVTFFLVHAADIPVARNVLGLSATDAQIDTKNAELGLDRPVVEQYATWVGHAVHGDLGTSYFTSEPVWSALETRLPVTLSVVVLSTVLTVVVSLALGCASAVRKGFPDTVLQGVSTLSYIFPAIILAVTLVLVFSINLHWVPATGYVPLAESPGRWFSSTILPAVSLALGGIASLSAQIRGSLRDELDRDYIRTLRSRGVSETRIVLVHALRNAASPSLTTLSLQFIGMFGGALFVERIFGLSGFGTYAFSATTQGDIPAIMGVTLFSVGLVVAVNLLVDLANGWLNPKARVA